MSISMSVAGEIKCLKTERCCGLKGDAFSITEELIFSHSSGVKSQRHLSKPRVTTKEPQSIAALILAGREILPFSSNVVEYSPVNKLIPLTSTFYHKNPLYDYFTPKFDNVN